MSNDRTRRPTTTRDVAEAAFKKATAKPVELPPAKPAVPGAKEMVSLRLDRDVLDHFQEAGPAGRTGSTMRCGLREEVARIERTPERREGGSVMRGNAVATGTNPDCAVHAFGARAFSIRATQVRTLQSVAARAGLSIAA